MWLSNHLSEERKIKEAETGVVEQINGNSLRVDSNNRVSNALLASPFGISAVPSAGDEVLLIPLADGRFIAAGRIVSNIREGEIKIEAPSGAFIALKANGEIELNGAVISKDGKLIEKI